MVYLTAAMWYYRTVARSLRGSCHEAGTRPHNATESRHGRHARRRLRAAVLAGRERPENGKRASSYDPESRDGGFSSRAMSAVVSDSPARPTTPDPTRTAPAMKHIPP